VAKKRTPGPKKKGTQPPQPPPTRVERACTYHGAWAEGGDFCLGVTDAAHRAVEVIRLGDLSPEALAEIAAAVRKVQGHAHQDEEE
jgi:hypothetical protein